MYQAVRYQVLQYRVYLENMYSVSQSNVYRGYLVDLVTVMEYLVEESM